MYIKTVNGRNYYKCDKCGKPYSFKSEQPVRIGMKAFCREHGMNYPVLIKKSK